ncbi:hypothetical protein SUDANB1_05597 [Streptomyces sp. enrichment culture]|uniref:ATP-binding protein n=1 Tax=Streptomyces sp. enrichment culture TaxID=1795815 RepID=UPI003F572CCF
MSEPRTAGGASLMARVQRVLDARGLGHVTAGPVDNTPRPDEPGHPEYHKRSRVEWAMSRWRASVPKRYQDAQATHPRVTKWADDYAADPEQAGFLLLTGPVGTGKTHEAYGALRRIAESGPDRYEVRATTAPDMYASLRPGGSEFGYEFEMRRLMRVPLLYLDDLGTEKVSDATEEATYRLLNERYNECRPMIITSNLPTVAKDGPDLTERLGERIASRLAQMTTVVPIFGPDRRRVAA